MQHLRVTVDRTLRYPVPERTVVVRAPEEECRIPGA